MCVTYVLLVEPAKGDLTVTQIQPHWEGQTVVVCKMTC